MNRRDFLLLLGAAGLAAGCTPRSGGKTDKTLKWYRCNCGILFKGRNAKRNGDDHVKEANDINRKLHKAFRHHLDREPGH